MALIGSLLVNLGLKSANFDKKLKKSKRGLRSFGESLKRGARRMAAFGTAMAAGALAIGVVFIKRQFQAIDAIGKLSDALQISTEALAGFGLAAEITGTDISTVNKGLAIFVRRIGEARQGTGEAVNGLEALGLNADKLSKAGTEEAFLQVAEGISRIENAADQAVVAYQLFGRSGATLINLFQGGRKSLEEFRKEVEDSGIALTRLEVAKVEAANDAITRMQKAFVALAQTISIGLAPIIEAAADSMTGWLNSSQDIGDSMIDMFRTLIKGASGFVGFLIAIVESLETIFRVTLGIIAAIAAAKIAGVVGGPVAAAAAASVAFTGGVVAANAILAQGKAGAAGVGDQVDKTFDQIGASADRFAKKVGQKREAARLRLARDRERNLGQTAVSTGAVGVGSGSFRILDRTRIALAGIAARQLDPQLAEQIRLDMKRNEILMQMRDSGGLQ